MAVMRLLPAILASLLFILSACRSTHDLGIDVEIEKHTLSNGLQVLMLEDHAAPVVSFQTWMRAGSIDELEGASGLAHLFEHLMFKGTKKHGQGAFFREFEAKGAQLNAFTTRDYTVYYEVVPTELLPKAIEMEADRLRNLELDQKLLDNEKMVVLEERRLRVENSPEGKIEEALWRLAYRNHPYGSPIIGSMEDLFSITLEKLTAFYDAYYQPSNTTLVVSGDFDPKETLRLIQTHYGPIPKKPRPPRNIEKEIEQTGERRLIIRDSVASERFARAYHITAANDDDRYALDVLANILFAGRDSRAYRRLVEDQQLLLSVSGVAFTPMHPGLFIISGTVRGNGKAESAEAELDRLVDELAEERPPTQTEVQTAVRQLLIEHLDSLRTPHGLGQLIGTVNAVLGDPDRFAVEADRYAKVTPGQVSRVASKYLHPNNRSVVILRSEEKGK